MCIEPIIEFFEREPDQDGVVEPERLKCFYHKGEKLQYQIYVDVVENSISISGDFEQPFGFSSLYEVYFIWDTIKIEKEPEFYGDQKILVCRKEHKELNKVNILMVMRWPNNELSIWQKCNHL